MTKLTFTQKAAMKNAICVFLVRGFSAVDERQFYTYVAVPGDRLEKFKKALDGSGNTPFQAQDYGRILQWGYGDPDEETMQRMEEEYGVNHTDMLVVPGPEDK